MTKILLLEDEFEIGQNLQFVLQKEGYQCDHFLAGDPAVEAALKDHYDLMILDIGLKQTGAAANRYSNGLEVARAVSQQKFIPYILLTARNDSYDIMTGLDMGAEDYITKPYNFTELLARIRAALRRVKNTAGEAAGTLKCRDIEMDLISHKVRVGGECIHLANQQFELLHYLLDHKDKVVTREELYENVWGIDPEHITDTGSLDQNIKRLRKAIGAKAIKTVRGIGYVLEERSQTNL